MEENLKKVISRLTEMEPEQARPLLERIKNQANIGRFPGVSAQLIEQEYQSAFNINEDVLPADVMMLFLESEEVVSTYCDDESAVVETLSESEILNFEKVQTLNESSGVNFNVTLESLLEV